MSMAVMKVEFETGIGFTMGPAERAHLVARAREIADSTEGGVRFTLDGEELRLTKEATSAASEPSQAARQADRVLTLEDAARLSEGILRSASELSDQILDRAAKRGAEALEHVAALQQRQADLQAAQAETALQQAVKVQQWVGGLTATVAEERLRMAEIGTAEAKIAERKALEAVTREVQLARITAERDIHLAQINRPSTGAVLLELAVAFAGQFAQNAAQNFAEMNNEPRKE